MAAKKNPRSKDVAYHATTTPGEFIEVTAHYVSGMNFATYETWTGYKLSFTSTKLSISRSGFLCSSFMMFKGKALKVEPAPRFNAKRLAAIAALANTLPDYDAVVKSLAETNGLTLTGEVLTKAEAVARATVEA